MSKYDNEIFLNTNTSPGKLAKYIENGSKVLEFGCATGRFTKYLKEEKECEVFIVEIDEEAYKIAKQYAYDGICTDISAFEWCNVLQREDFDYIVFADVLEHLSNPTEVLSKTSLYLKDDGKVLISIPNIAHNSVIAKLYYNRFEYTSTGVLDNTHVHFWGYRDLNGFIGNTPYKIVELDGVRISSGDTEQKIVTDFYLENRIEELLKERTLGDVYQFVLCLQKKKFVEINQISCKDFLENIDISLNEMGVYFDFGKGFNENEKDFVYWNATNGEIEVNISLRGGAKRIRLDFTEKYFCVVNRLEIFSNKGILDVTKSNGIALNENVIFLVDDPYIIVDVTEDISWIKITGRIVTTVNRVWHSVMQELIACLGYDNRHLKRAKCYCDWGKGFNEQDTFFVIPQKSGLYKCKYNINLPNSTSHLRLDFIEGASCFVKDVEVLSNVVNMQIESSGFAIKNGYILYGKDPWLHFWTEGEEIKWIEIEAKIEYFEEEEISKLVEK